MFTSGIIQGESGSFTRVITQKQIWEMVLYYENSNEMSLGSQLLYSYMICRNLPLLKCV